MGKNLGEGVAHLRWFIVDEKFRGTGVGRRLLADALWFADARYGETHLWSVEGLNAARHLYESCGFALVSEWAGTQWGMERLEQQFMRKRPAV